MKPVKLSFFKLFLIISLSLSPTTSALSSMKTFSDDQINTSGRYSSLCHNPTQTDTEIQKYTTMNTDYCSGCIDCHCLAHAGCHQCNSFFSFGITTNFSSFFLTSNSTVYTRLKNNFTSLNITPESPPPIA